MSEHEMKWGVVGAVLILAALLSAALGANQQKTERCRIVMASSDAVARAAAMAEDGTCR